MKIAVVNLKKSPFNASNDNNTKADRLMVNAYAQRDQDPLRQQIDLIAPNVVIGCGVQRPLIWLLGLTPEDVAKVAVGKQEGRRVHLVRGGADEHTASGAGAGAAKEGVASGGALRELLE